MAPRTITTYICDWDDKEVAEADHVEHQLSLDGEDITLDFCTRHEAMFRKPIDKFMGMGRRTLSTSARARVTARRKPRRTAAKRAASADVRKWAKAQGLPVSDKGRIPVSVQDKYDRREDRHLSLVAPATG